MAFVGAGIVSVRKSLRIEAKDYEKSNNNCIR